MQPSVTHADINRHFTDDIVVHEFFDLLCGKFLGGGVGRGVYVLATDPDLVVKIETRNYSFQNTTEWAIWQDLTAEGNKMSRWFAPCHSISPCGIVMIQSRTRPVSKEMFPNTMPSFFSDLKYQNFGVLDGHLVAHDYGYSNILSQGLTKRMRKAVWRDDDIED